MREKVLFRGIEGSVYPGFKGSNGYVENLSLYREDAQTREHGRVIVDAWLAFDIERHVSWDKNYTLLPYSYSMMIDGYFPISRFSWLGAISHPTWEEFVGSVSRLGGFVLDEEMTNRRGKPQYFHSEMNIFVNWRDNTNSTPKTGRDRINIGVIQQEEVSDLSLVTDKITPYAVEVFNYLSPTRKISQRVVEQSIKFATEGNKIIPKCRILRIS